MTGSPRPEYRLHCFCQSGNAYKVALMLALTGTPWEPVFVDFMHGATREPDWRTSVNAMGEVPVLEHAGRRLTQSGVILHYLAEQLGRFGGADEDQQREIWRWILFDNHKFTSYMASYRFMKCFAATVPDASVMAWLKGRLDGAYGLVERHLGGTDFLAGAQPTIADLSLCGYLFYPIEEHGIDIERTYPNIFAWLGRIRSMPGWLGPYQLLPGERLAPLR